MHFVCKAGHRHANLQTLRHFALQAAPKYADRDILVGQMMETTCPPTDACIPPGTTSNKRLGNAVIQSVPSGNSHGGGQCPTITVVINTEQCQTLDESFPFLPIGWVAERIENTFILGPGPPSSPRSHQTGNNGWSGRGVARPDQQCLQTQTPNDYEGHSGTGGPIVCGDCSVR